MKDLNSDFFYDIALDEDNKICSVFWADARTRAAYEEFDDVVSFDTTYLRNKYDIPFAPFVGVNHHGNSILLGYGLMSSKDTASFVWLFQCWLRCMRNKPPIGIITDQCRAMANAIQEVFPNTRHRWCLWHIMKKLPEKFQGMSTTQRSEGMNAFFDGFINYSTTLQQFVVQYDNAPRVKAQKEIQVDFSSLNMKVTCGSQSPIERQFQLEYTHARFEEVQTEFRSRMNCFIKETVKDDFFNTYTMKEERMWEGKCADKFFKVQLDPETKHCTCSCLLFEFRGIIYRHCLLVFGQEDAYSVP
ncbi:protein FAR1-RELATED SEQUENCE 5-like [Vigna umbellata]|uniref:protein FAR1-RELATED SEQUENCE 5-like n=1 Tax=Vigna umbellata TaxID=87088 RepID=UPI001F5F1E9D|nr:protein FAR1-RELATED SEQUENCE 5-like [Vigna umbellata]